MVEETQGFDETLELDRRVWEILAKIEARKARELTGCAGNTVAELARCFSLKLRADGQLFESSTTPAELRVAMNACAWVELLHRSRREHLALRIAETVCRTEGRVWCAEFGGEYEFEIPVMNCGGTGRCEMRFVRKSRAS
jgi:hypothetical protein